jgi:hypothetical protein
VIVTPTTTTSPLVIATATTAPAPIIVAPTTSGLDDLVQATVPPDGGGPDDPIGGIDPTGDLPDGLDLAAFPGAEAPAPAADGPTFAAGLSCAYQCVKSGVAYPRGIGALLVVETHVPARLWMSVVDDNYDPVDFTSTTDMVSEYNWALDHLEPGRTYYAMVAATDENDDTAHAYGEFTTLAERTVHVTIGDVTVEGGPQNVDGTAVALRVDGFAYWSVDPGSGVSSVYADRGRRVDLALFTFRSWETSQYTICEGYDPDDMPAQGDSDELCGSWNSAVLDNVDLDVIPAGANTWTTATIQTTFNTSSGDDPLPGGYGDPRFFHFSAPVTLDVSYH